MACLVEWLFLVLFYCCGRTFSTQLSKQLFYNLMHRNDGHPKDYIRTIRPADKNGTGKLTVKLGIRLSQLLDVDEKNQIMITNVWMKHEWYDYRLVWSPEEYGNVRLIHIPIDEIWRPDVVLYNNVERAQARVYFCGYYAPPSTTHVWDDILQAISYGHRVFIASSVRITKIGLIEEELLEILRMDGKLHFSADGDFEVTLKTKAKVHYNGIITWEPPAIYKSYCPIDVEYFPFDIQECFMKFGSWTYDDAHIDMKHFCMHLGVKNIQDHIIIDKGMDMKQYYPNNEWDVINVTARWRQRRYTCCDYAYSDLTFNVTLRRKTLFYSLNLIVPCVSISLLTVLVFYLPADSAEKITLSISILLALTVFFLLLSAINPPTSLVIPLIGKYLLFTMIVVTLSIFLTVYTLSIHYRSPSTHEMAPWVKRVFTEILPIVLMINRPAVKKRQTRLPENCIEMSQLHEHTYENVHHYENGKRTLCPCYHPEVVEALQSAVFVAEGLREKDRFEEEVMDWKFVAKVIDRLFLFIFSIACIVGSISLLMKAPSLFDTRPELAFSTEEDISEDCIF